MTKAISLATSISLCAALPAYADPAMECGIGNGSQVEIADCVTDTEAAVDASIEIALGFAMASAEDLDAITERNAAVPALEASQESWRAYRDAHCDFIGARFGGGSGTGIGIRACRIELGRARVAALMSLTQ